jgi:hypothetical protein
MRYVLQVVQLTPSLITRLSTNTKLPGVWMHIIGMLRLPTSFLCAVWNIWGRYWNMANTVDKTPKNVAHHRTARTDGCSLAGDSVGGDGFRSVRRRRKVIKVHKTKCNIVTNASVKERRYDGDRVSFELRVSAGRRTSRGS